MIAYYATLHENQGWSKAWRVRALETEILTLRRSPLFRLVRQHLPQYPYAGLVLDAGCGLGAWVALLIELGYRCVGIDAVYPPPSSLPVQMGNVKNLAMLADGAVGVYLSLGVIEHEEHGPDAILKEAARVLEPNGLALVSVPYVNGLRRLLWLWIQGKQFWKRDHGAKFYQYAYSKHELIAALSRHGLRVVSTHPYGPTKMFRTWFSEATRDAYDSKAYAGVHRGRRTRGLLRWFLYTRPMLRLCGHMVLAVAVKT